MMALKVAEAFQRLPHLLEGSSQQQKGNRSKTKSNIEIRIRVYGFRVWGIRV